MHSVRLTYIASFSFLAGRDGRKAAAVVSELSSSDFGDRLVLTLELIREMEDRARRGTDGDLRGGGNSEGHGLAAYPRYWTKLCRHIGVQNLLYRSFANRRQLASYVGIAPMPYQSGGIDRDRSISRAGNPRARTPLIQLAWLWLRLPARQRAGDMVPASVSAHLQGRTRRIAIVAMARKLLIAPGATSRPAWCRMGSRSGAAAEASA